MKREVDNYQQSEVLFKELDAAEKKIGGISRKKKVLNAKYISGKISAKDFANAIVSLDKQKGKIEATIDVLSKKLYNYHVARHKQKIQMEMKRAKSAKTSSRYCNACDCGCKGCRCNSGCRKCHHYYP
ncbi:MAG: hypothetical protein AABX01_05060 [Candidatus Micrarchaeota archaeon]